MKTKKDIQRSELQKSIETYLKSGGKITSIEIEDKTPVNQYSNWDDCERSNWCNGSSHKTFKPKLADC